MDEFEQGEYEWLDRSDDYNVFEENQLALDNEAGYGDEDADETVEADDVQGYEDDGYESSLFGADC